MIKIKSIAIAIMMMATTTQAFTPSSSNPQSSQNPSSPNTKESTTRATTTTTTTTTRLQFLQKTLAISTTALIIPQSSYASSDPFALPSYSDAIKNKSVEMNLDEVNKKILDDAAAKRDDKGVNKVNNERYIQLKMEEAEEEKRLERMRELAKREREERIAQEKAEAKANRWNTF